MTIRLLKKSDWPVIAEFNKIQYRPDHILTNKIYYDWQFDNVFNPNKDDYTSLGLFDKSGKLSGTIGLFPAPCNFFGESVKCNWIANLIVKENLRSLGYGALLLNAAEKGFDLAVDHNVNDLARPLFEKMGYQVDDIKRYLCVLNPAEADVLAGQTGLQMKIFTGGNLGISPSLKFEVIKRCGREFDLFWEEVKSRYPISIDRSSRYLNWRYANNPLVKYVIFAGYDGDKIGGFVVLRIEDITSGAEKKSTGIRIGWIIDLAVHEREEEQLLLRTVKFCQDQGLGLIDFFFTGNFPALSLDKAGFMDANIHPYSLIPTLLNPINRVKRTRNNFAFKLINQDYFNKNMTDLSNWYTTKGCGDQDRPS